MTPEQQEEFKKAVQ
jgi:hypothetical protein